MGDGVGHVERVFGARPGTPGRLPATDTGSLKTARRMAMALVAALGLSGCVVGPNFETPDAPEVSGYLPKKAATIRKPSGHQLLAYGADLPGDWWRVFGSRKLNELVELGLKHNADLEAAEAAVRVAEANALVVRGGLWPTVAANANSSRQVTPTRTLTSNHADGRGAYNLHTAQLTVSYVADVFGGVRRQVEAAEAQVEMQDMQRRAVALTLTSNIALAAIQQASFEGQIEATRRLIDLQTDLLNILKRQLAAGQIALPDVLVQETAVAQAKLLLPPLERQRDQQSNLLAVLTGRFPSEAGRQRFRLDSFRSPRQLPVSLPADLVRQRPDVRVAEANLKQANAQIGVAIAARLPQITLTGNGGSTADAVSKLFSPGTLVGLIAGNVVQTLFDGRTLAMKQLAAEETLNQMTAQYRGVVLTAFQNVADVLLALDADNRALAAAIEAEAAATRSLTLFRQQVEQGQVALSTLISAQQAYQQTSIARVQAQASRLANMVALYQALGGGWWNREGDHHDHKAPHDHHLTLVKR